MRNLFFIFTAALILSLAVITPAAQAQTFHVLHQFNGGVDDSGITDGANPHGSLVRDAAGNLYGTTFDGGGVGEGVVFKIASTGAEHVLFTFQALNGEFPATPLIQNPAGDLLGIADGGPGAGIVYKLSQAGEQTRLFAFEGGLFTGKPGVPSGGILLDKKGNIFGTTLFGGKGHCQFSCGSIYRLDPAGKLHVRYNFTGEADGSLPFGPLVEDSEGNLYGVANQGGNLNCAEFAGLGCGTVFKLSKTRVFTVLHTFLGGADGAAPQAGLLLDAAGNLYGAALRGGDSDNGTVFKIARDGSYTILHKFNGQDGTNPNGGLAADATGNLYGTTQLGGKDSLGTVWRLNGSGQVKVLHAFAGGDDGAVPLAGVIVDLAGNVYGTAVKNFLIQRVQGGCVFVITP
jgi:uncharacterized repeat protein (TIGR03803 family)